LDLNLRKLVFSFSWKIWCVCCSNREFTVYQNGE